MIGVFFIGLLIGGYAGLLTAALLFASEDERGGRQ
jgi:gas vesicle protein